MHKTKLKSNLQTTSQNIFKHHLKCAITKQDKLSHIPAFSVVTIEEENTTHAFHSNGKKTYESKEGNQHSSNVMQKRIIHLKD